VAPLYHCMVLLMLIGGGSINDQKSIGGHIVFLGTTLISWKSGKQRTVARSSTEAEYKALVDGIIEVLWLHYLLFDLYFFPSFVTTIWCDNLGATFYLLI